MDANPLPPAYLPAITLLAQIRALGSLGVDLRPIHAKLGDLPSERDAPDAVVPASKYSVFWAAALAAYPAPGLPTALAMAIPFGGMGVIDYLTVSAATIAGSCESLLLHLSLVATDTVLEQQCAAEGLHTLAVRGLGMFPAVAMEFTLAIIVNRFRYLTAGEFRPTCVMLPVQRSADESVRARLFAAPIAYASQVASIEFSDAAWRLAVVRADPFLHAALTRMAAQLPLVRPAQNELQAALRVRLRDALASGNAEFGRMARLLGMSERTLQRRLSEDAVNFSALVETFRREESTRLLANPRMTLVKVAGQLGYAEQTSFVRAFRRWTGTTPGAWRRANMLKPDEDALEGH